MRTDTSTGSCSTNVQPLKPVAARFIRIQQSSHALNAHNRFTVAEWLTPLAAKL